MRNIITGLLLTLMNTVGWGEADSAFLASTKSQYAGLKILPINIHAPQKDSEEL